MTAQTSRAANDSLAPNDLEAWWLPFTANRSFKQRPRLIARAKGMYYYTPDGREVIDGAAGLWCCNAGHNRDEITQAIQAQAQELDYSPAFQFGHAGGFALASRLAQLAPGDLNHVFFCNSGSEAVDTALKLALAYWNVRGQGSKTRLIGRERGYHGVGFGGISVGGIVKNRQFFGTLLAGYPYSGHPLACASALAAQDIYRDEKLFERAQSLEPVWADAIHSLKDLPNVLDIRTIGIVAAIDLASSPDGVGKRAYEAMDRAFQDFGLMMRVTGDTIALSPPLIITEEQIGEIVEKLTKVIKAVA